MAEVNMAAVTNRIRRVLHSLASEEYNHDVAGELLSVIDRISDVQFILPNDEVRSFLGGLKDLLQDTVDLVREMIMVDQRRSEISGAKKVLTFFSPSYQLVASYKLRIEIEKLRKAIGEMVTKIPSYDFTSLPVASKFIDEPHETSSFVDEEEVIGRNSDKQEIMNLILQRPENTTEENVRVISVVGVPGIGKTTLAQLVFNDYHIEQNFELRLWAFMGSDSSTKKIVLRLLEGAGVSAGRYLEMDQLLKELRKTINGKRCFIVMDDMVDHNHLHWLSLKDLLIGYAKDSCVLLTTRSEKVAKLTHTASVQPYCLDRLTEDDSWFLLQKQAITMHEGSDECELLELEEIGREITAKCEGVPSSLRLVLTILESENRRFPWFQLNDVEKINEILGKNARETRVTNAGWRQTYSFVPQDMVGREDEKRAIIVELLKKNPEEKVSVIPIVGIGGVGKTALAQFIFNDEMVECHFDLKIWVCVTEVFDLKVIVEKIILSITRNYPENLELDQLEILLCQEIREKRYLLILDDVWNEDEDKWKELMTLLSDAACGSKIIVTTRSKRVVEISGEGHQHELQMLDEDKSWLLFLKVAFEQREHEHPTDTEIIKVGKEIVNKCGGNPLVIRTIGSILFFKNQETWQSFYDKELLKILENDSNVLATLRLSYDHLPPPVKECFAYCALFPKDYEIDVMTLVFLWTSQGLTRFTELNDEGQDLEELGNAYFMSLLGRSFFQDPSKDELGKITKCKLQNLMHDLARKVAGNAYATLRLKEDKFDGLPRHVSFDFHLDSSWQIPIPSSELKIIRSFILLRQFRWSIDNRSSESICDVILKFKLLRMLDLHNSGIKMLPNSIGELVHLRYLDLSQNVNIKKLPNSICRLRNLQTLKLNRCSNLQKLPRNIKMLRRLRRLENESCYCLTHMPQGLSELLNLRTLSEFVLSKDTTSVKKRCGKLDELLNLRTLSEFVLCKDSTSVSKQSGKLDELRDLDHLKGKLRIKNLRFLEDDKTAEAKLNKKQDLLSLVLIWDIDASTSEADCEKSLDNLKPHPNLRELSLSAYGGSKFSSWLSAHENLVKLSLSRCKSCHCLPQLGHLPNLEVLVVDELIKLEYISDDTATNESTMSFSSLKELRLTNLLELKGWWKDASKNDEEEAEFPRLSKLVVQNCPLTSMPLFPCLEELLVLKNTSWDPFQRTMAAEKRFRRKSEFEVSSSSSSSSSTSFTGSPLSNLRTIHIAGMSEGNPNMWQFLPSVRSVTLDHLADINDLLEGLRQVASLQQLHIWRCNNLEKIPSWISDNKSIKTISIKLCPNLSISPEGISLITSLKKVVIEDCPRVSHIESMLKDPLYIQ